MKDDLQFEIVELENMSPEARQRAIEYLKKVQEKLYQELQTEQQEKERERAETIQKLESRFAYCPDCCGVVAKLEEQPVCPNCKTAVMKLTQANHQVLSEYLKHQELDVDFARYIWQPKYSEYMTHFCIRWGGKEFCGKDAVLSYTQYDDSDTATGKLSVILSEKDWRSIREFLKTLNISRWITPCELAMQSHSRYEKTDGFLCFCDKIYSKFYYFPDPKKAYLKEYLALFAFIKQVFQGTEGWQSLEKGGADMEEPGKIPDIRVTIRNDSTGEMKHIEIPFSSKVLIGNTPKAHIPDPSMQFVYALRPQGDHFLLSGGDVRFRKVWTGERWTCSDRVKKGDRFKLRDRVFTLVDYEYIAQRSV